jgi:hypothetical protein
MNPWVLGCALLSAGAAWMRAIFPSATITSNAQESGQSIVQVVRMVLVTKEL